VTVRADDRICVALELLTILAVILSPFLSWLR